MTLEELKALTEQIPTLIQKVERLESENVLLSTMLEQVQFMDTLLTVSDVSAICGVTEATARMIMNKAGASRLHNRLFLRYQDLTAYLMQNRQLTEQEAKRAAQRYLLKKRN